MRKRGKHTTVEKELKQSIKWLESLSFIEKVVLCIYSPVRHKYTPGTLRYQRTSPGGLILKAYGGSGLMDLYVKISDEYISDFVKTLDEKYE